MKRPETKPQRTGANDSGLAFPLTAALIEKLWDVGYDSLTGSDLDCLRNLLLDHVGVVARGSRTPSAHAVQRFADDSCPASDPLPIIGTNQSSSPILAAMANAVAGHSIEYDDTHAGASLHPGVVAFPSALAAAALGKGTARDFLLASLIGYEVMCRVGRAVNPPAHYQAHFHPTGTCGAFGAAAAAARMLGLNRNQAANALDIASTSAAGSTSFLVGGAWTKHWHPASAARIGVEAATLSSYGFLGPSDGLGSEHGFLIAHSRHPMPELLLDGLGQDPYEIHNTGIKTHTCCRYNQAAVDGLLQLRAQHDLQPIVIEAIKVGLVSPALNVVWEPVAERRRPASVADAQFSIGYTLALALVNGRVGPNDYRADRLNDPVLLDLTDRVTCLADPELDRHYPNKWGAWVEVTTKDGVRFDARVDEPRGDPGWPLTATEMEQKFRDLVPLVYSEERQTAIIGAVTDLGDGVELPEFLELLPTDLV